MFHLDDLSSVRIAGVFTSVITLLFFEGLSRAVVGTEINAVYSDGIVRSFQLDTSGILVRRPMPESQNDPQIPPYCRSSLVDSCLQAEANGTIFYVPIANSSLVVKLTSNKIDNQTTLMKEIIQLSCFPSDLVTMVSGSSLVVACRDVAETHDFCVGSACGNILPPNDLNNHVTPIAYNGIHQDTRDGQIIATTQNHQLVTFIPSSSERRTYNLLANGCSEPLDLSRQKSTVLLTCTNETQFWVNITFTIDLNNVDFYPIDTSHGPLLALSNHGFALFLTGSQLTLQKILPDGNAVTQTIPIDNTGHTVFGDFTTDGRYAFVAVNSTAVLFIHVTEAVTDNGGQYFHTITTDHPLCPTCPAVQFLSTTIAVVSSYNTENTMVSVILLTQWPPCVYTSRILIGQPKQYWFNPVAPLPVSCGVGPVMTSVPPQSTTRTPSPPVMSVSPSPTNKDNGSSGLSSEAIAGIAVGTLVGLVIGVLVILLLVYGAYKYNTRSQERLSNVVQQPPNNQHVMNPAFEPTEAQDNPSRDTSTSQMLVSHVDLPPIPATAVNPRVDEEPQPVPANTTPFKSQIVPSPMSTTVVNSTADDKTPHPIPVSPSVPDISEQDK